MRILLVEDTDDTREVYKLMIQRLGHEVIEATGGKEAIAVAIKHLPHLVLIDLSMPEVDGFQAVSALRSFPSFERIPIIALTGYPQSHWRDRAEDVGCDHYLQKPISSEHLSIVLTEYGSAGLSAHQPG